MARKRAEGDPAREWLLWTLGAVLSAHMAAFMGISYFDQTQVWWFVTLGMICAVTTKRTSPNIRKSKQSSAINLDRTASIPQSGDLMSTLRGLQLNAVVIEVN